MAGGDNSYKAKFTGRSLEDHRLCTGLSRVDKVLRVYHLLPGQQPAYAMATWFKQLKTKYWDGEPYKNLPNSGFVIIGVRTPWARPFWKEQRGEIK